MTASERIRQARVFEEASSKQRETIGMLHSYIENLKYAFEDFDPRLIVFQGDGQDGPCCGWINPNGTVDWMVEA